MSDNFELDDNYGINENYSDPQVFIIGQEKAIPEITGQLLIAGENNAQSINFEMDRYYDGIDISDKQINILYSAPQGYADICHPINVKKGEDKIRFTWVVPAHAVMGAGELIFSVEFVGDDYVLKTLSCILEIEDGMLGHELVSPPEDKEWYLEMQSLWENLKETEATRVESETSREQAEKLRAQAETLREQAEKLRAQAEASREQAERKRESASGEAIKKVNTASEASEKAANKCEEITEKATIALQNQDQLEATLNSAIQIKQAITQSQEAVEAARKKVEADKKEINDTIQNSLLESANEILESVKNYFNRAEALYESLYIECDGESPQSRAISIVTIDAATPQIRTKEVGIDFDGGTPMSRSLAV